MDGRMVMILTITNGIPNPGGRSPGGGGAFPLGALLLAV